MLYNLSFKTFVAAIHRYKVASNIKFLEQFMINASLIFGICTRLWLNVLMFQRNIVTPYSRLLN